MVLYSNNGRSADQQRVFFNTPAVWKLEVNASSIKNWRKRAGDPKVLETWIAEGRSELQLEPKIIKLLPLLKAPLK